MADNDKSVFIDDLKTIRSILKEMYVCCFYTNTDHYKKLGISSVKFNNERSRMEIYIPAQYRNSMNSGHNKIHSLSVPAELSDNVNFLAEAYKMHRVNKNYILYNTLVLAALGSGPKSKNGLREYIEQAFYSVMSRADDDPVKEKPLAGVLKDLTECGCIRFENDMYSLRPDFFEGLDEENRRLLYYAAQLYSHKCQYNTAAYFLAEAVGGTLDLRDSGVFTYEYDFMSRTLNDWLLNDIIDAIESNRKITLKYGGKSMKICPVRIVSEYAYGKQYILGVRDGSSERFYKKLDEVDAVEIDSETFDRAAAEALIKESGSGEYIRAEVMGGAETAEMIKREGVFEVTELTDGRVMCRAPAGDYRRLKPYIRSLAPNVSIIRDSAQAEKLYASLEKERKEALENYENFSEK